MRFIQTADLHLDAAFSYLPSINRKKRREELRKAFQKIVEITIKKEVDALLILGDLFESYRPPKDTVNFVLSELEKIAEVGKNVLIIPGNHDFFNLDSVYNVANFPENVHIFTEEEFIEFLDPKSGTVFYGIACKSFKSEQNVLKKLRVKNQDKLNIGLLHGSLDYGFFHGEQCYPFKENELKETGLDYLALGHYHNLNFSQDQVPYAYSGSPASLNFTEHGERVALLIDVEKNKFEIEKLAIDGCNYQVFNLDCTNFNTSEKIKEEISRLGDLNTYMRVILKGAPPLELNINVESLSNELNDRFAFMQIIEDFTFPELTGYERSKTIKSIFIKTIQKKIESASKEEKKLYDLAARLGISAIEGNLD